MGTPNAVATPAGSRLAGTPLSVVLLPVKVPSGAVAVPDSWAWARPLIDAAVAVTQPDDRFVYFTVSSDPAAAVSALASLRPDHLRPADIHMLWTVAAEVPDDLCEGVLHDVLDSEGLRDWLGRLGLSVLVSVSHRAFDGATAVANPALGVSWPTWPKRDPNELVMTLAEVHEHQLAFAAGLAPSAGRHVRFRPGANSSGGSQVAADQAGFWVVPEEGVMGLDCTDTALLAGELERIVRRGFRVLDVTTGSGVNAVTAALAGGVVTANDIDPIATACAAANAAHNGVAVTVTCGSLFEAVEGTFDVIFGNPPFIATHPSPDRLAHNGSGWRAFVGDVYDSLFAGAREHLAPGGQLLVVCAEWGDLDDYLASAVRHRWTGEAVAVRDSRDGLRRYRLDRWTPAS